jgi:hypothetical protein
VSSSDVVDCVIAALPWAGFYGAIYAISRLAGPALFSHARKLDDPTLSYWAASVVSTANSLVIVPMAIAAGRPAGLFAFDASFTAATPLSTMCCQALVGYTLWDALPLIYYRKEWGSFGMYMVHHIGAALGWGMCAITGVGHNFAVPALLFEATAPFTNGRWFLSTAGLKETRLYIANGVGMALSFFVLRIVYNLWIVSVRFGWQAAEFYAAAPGWMLAACYPLYAVNLALQFMWFSKIVTGIIALVAGKPKSTKKKN